MSQQIQVAPSILAADFTRLGEEVAACESADLIHVDVMDGRFVPPITIGQQMVSALKRVTSRPLDVHLMIEHPLDQVASFVDAGADIVTVHVEACRHLHRALGVIRSTGARAGVALNPATPISAVECVLDVVDLVLVMTVNPGWGGQSLIPATIDKVRGVAGLLRNAGLSAVDLEVDGGVSPDNVAQLSEAGANVLVAGNSIFTGSCPYEKSIEALRASAKRAVERQPT